MVVEQLVKELQKFPKDLEVIIFDGPSYVTPSKIYICNWENSKLKGKLIID